MPRPTKSDLEALVDLLDPTAVTEAALALAAILERQTERVERARRMAREAA
jgi:hypothetical protein